MRTTRSDSSLRMSSHLGLAILVLLSLVAAACGGGGSDTDEASQETPTAAETTDAEPTATAGPTVEPSPTPTDFELGELTNIIRSPLNGTSIDERSTTRILTVKVDNHPNARPQSGIQNADMMIEIYVEGITRFLAVFQDSEANTLGPIRSMRPTDFSIQNSWESYFVNSGGQGWVQSIGNASQTQWLQEPSGSFRVGFRSAPHNLYGDTESFRNLNNRGDYEEPLDPLWNFGNMPDDAEAATEILTSWPQGFQSSWSWNGTEYEKTTSGAPHNYTDDDGNNQRVVADTLVMFEVSIFTQSGGANTTAVPVSETTGSGTAWVFADGVVTQGTWARESTTDWFVLTGEDGSEMTVPPGRLWLILPQLNGVDFS